MECKTLSISFLLAFLVSMAMLSPTIMAESDVAAPPPYQSDLDAVTPSDPTLPIIYVISVEWPANVDRSAYAISLMSPAFDSEEAAKKALIGTYVTVPTFGATLTGLQVATMKKNPEVLSAWPTSQFYLDQLASFDNDLAPKAN